MTATAAAAAQPCVAPWRCERPRRQDALAPSLVFRSPGHPYATGLVVAAAGTSWWWRGGEQQLAPWTCVARTTAAMHTSSGMQGRHIAEWSGPERALPCRNAIRARPPPQTNAKKTAKSHRGPGGAPRVLPSSTHTGTVCNTIYSFATSRSTGSLQLYCVQSWPLNPTRNSKSRTVRLYLRTVRLPDLTVAVRLYLRTPALTNWVTDAPMRAEPPADEDSLGAACRQT